MSNDASTDVCSILENGGVPHKGVHDWFPSIRFRQKSTTFAPPLQLVYEERCVDNLSPHHLPALIRELPTSVICAASRRRRHR